MKISLQEWICIGISHPAKEWVRKFCTHKLVKDGKHFRRECYLNLPFYILFFIPYHLLLFFCLCYDEGFKNFEIQPRLLGYDMLMANTKGWEIAKEIYEKQS